MKLYKPVFVVAPLVQSIVSSSLESGIVPDSMKRAIITPLLKKPTLDRQLFKNYRPVSNLSFLSKVLEKIVASRLKSYMEENDMCDPFQSAYRTGHSTETALMKVHNDISRSLDNRGVVVLVILDLSAAFDTVDHGILLERMRSLLGVEGVALDWFTSYLTGRLQQVRIGDSWSLAKFLLYSVPQGSVLGPLLFLIYILPLYRLILAHGLGSHGYADDRQLYLVIEDPGNLVMVTAGCQQIERCVVDVHKWMTANKLKLNEDKTEIQVFGTAQRVGQVNIQSLSIAGISVVVSSAAVVNLGVAMDIALDMSSQINRTVRSAQYHLRNIGRIRNRLTTDATRSLVQSLVISRLDYCNSLLYGLPETTQLSRLRRIHHQAARLITRKGRSVDIPIVLKSLHWIPIEYRICFKILCNVYKAVNGLGPQYLSDLLTPYVPPRNLRSKDLSLLVVPKTNLKIGKRSFSVCGPHLWNSLPISLRKAESLE